MSRKRLEAILHVFSISGDKDYAISQIEKVFRERKEKPAPYDKTTAEFVEQSIAGVYEAYPRKVGKPAALKAIRKAVQIVMKERSCNAYLALDYLLERTELYATARQNEDPKFTPHPATWFNQQRYNDSIEQKEWAGAPDEHQLFR